MKIYKYTIFTIILFLLSITNIYAACTQEEINNFKKVEDQYTVKYEFDKSTKTYKTTFYTPYADKYTYAMDDQISMNEFDTITEEKFTILGVRPGEYKIEIIGLTEECDESLKTLTLKLPKYNQLSDDPLCKGVEEFVLCNPTYEKEIDYEVFVSRIETYKKNKLKQELENNKTEEQKTENEFLNRIIKYLKDNLIQIIIVIVFIVLLTITIIVTAKSIRKSRRLE